LTAQKAIIISKILKAKTVKIDCNLILAGALLHDLGRCQSHELDHAIIGADILRKLNYPTCLCQLVENHLLAGIKKEEASELGLPEKDFIPLSLEEKIVSYSDNISKNNIPLTTNEVISKYRKYYDEFHPILNRIKSLHDEIESLLQ